MNEVEEDIRYFEVSLGTVDVGRDVRREQLRGMEELWMHMKENMLKVYVPWQ